MVRKYQKESYGLFRVWLLLLAALTVVFSLFPGRFSSLGEVRTVGILLFVMVDILFALVTATQSVYWLEGVSYEEAAAAGESTRRKYAFCRLLIFLAGTALYLVYCFYPQAPWPTGTYMDSMTAGALMSLAVVLSHRQNHFCQRIVANTTK